MTWTVVALMFRTFKNLRANVLVKTAAAVNGLFAVWFKRYLARRVALAARCAVQHGAIIMVAAGIAGSCFTGKRRFIAVRFLIVECFHNDVIY